jgi:hypothetical protein
MKDSYLGGDEAIVLVSTATAGVEGEQRRPAHHDQADDRPHDVLGEPGAVPLI